MSRTTNLDRTSTRLSNWLLGLALVGLATLAAPARTSADTITVLNFDSTVLPAGQFTDATPYLNSFGVTFNSPQSTATPTIFNDVGSAITAVSPPNFFAVNVAQSQNNSPMSYTLTFNTPLDAVSFNTAVVASFSTYPTWTATAFDGAVPVGSPVGQTGGFGTGATQLFTIDGPDITSLTFANFSTGQSVDNEPIDNLTLVTPTPTPEPNSVLLLGTGLLGLVTMFWYRKRLGGATHRLPSTRLSRGQGPDIAPALLS